MWDYFPFPALGTRASPCSGGRPVYKSGACAALGCCVAVRSQQLRGAPRAARHPRGDLEKELPEVSGALLTVTSHQADRLGEYYSGLTCAPRSATDDVIVCLCCPSKQRKDVQCFLKLDKPKISLN